MSRFLFFQFSYFVTIKLTTNYGFDYSFYLGNLYINHKFHTMMRYIKSVTC